MSVFRKGSNLRDFWLSPEDQADQDGVLDRLVLTMLKSPDWDPDRFSKDNGVDKIRAKILDETLEQYGAHIAQRTHGCVEARLACIRRIEQEWDKQAGKHNNTQWEPHQPINNLQLTSKQKSNARRKIINDRYSSMEREVQINVVNTLSDNDKTRLAVHLALGWYKDYVVPSGAA